MASGINNVSKVHVTLKSFIHSQHRSTLKRRVRPSVLKSHHVAPELNTKSRLYTAFPFSHFTVAVM